MRLWLGVSVRAVGVWTGDPVPGLLGVRIEMGCIEGVVREASVPGCVTWREFQCRAEGVVQECSGGCGQVQGRPFSARLRVLLRGLNTGLLVYVWGLNADGVVQAPVPGLWMWSEDCSEGCGGFFSAGLVWLGKSEYQVKGVVSGNKAEGMEGQG